MARNHIAGDWTSRVRVRICPHTQSCSSTPGCFSVARTAFLAFSAHLKKYEIKYCTEGVSFSFNKKNTYMD